MRVMYQIEMTKRRLMRGVSKQCKIQKDGGIGRTSQRKQFSAVDPEDGLAIAGLRRKTSSG